MSFNALNLNKTADISSAFLGSVIDDVISGKPDLRKFGAGPDIAAMDLALNRVEQLEHARRLLSPAVGSEATEDYRLVKRCKSPTRSEIETSRRLELNKQLFDLQSRETVKNHAKWLEQPESEQKYQQRYIGSQVLNMGTTSGLNVILDEETGELKAKTGQRAPIARIYHREWSDEYRIRVMAQASASEPPPQQEGDRETSELSQKGASKILDAGAYVSAVRGGFSTFLTLTFDNEAQQRIVDEESTIGREVSRFFDAASKMYQRGWQCDNRVLREENGFQCIGAAEVVPEKDDKLDYIWVAEMPDSESRGKNPHCHVLLRWDIEPYLFHDWAKRLEDLWGLGFAKLERIRNADAASGYLLKALGYVVKGSSKDQGTFKGNRYNISAAARAPAWECISEFEAQNMVAIINEVREKWQRKDAPIKSEIKKEKADLVRYQKAYKINQFKKGVCPEKRKTILEKIKARMAAIDERVTQHWKQLKSRGARANEYQITFKGWDKLGNFIGWASSTRYWAAELLTDGAYRADSDHAPLHDWEHLRESMGQLVKTARSYWRGLAPVVENSEMHWQAIQESDEPVFEHEGITTDEYYNEYYNQWSEVAA